MYSQYLYGGSLRIIRDKLDEAGVPNLKGEPGWSISTIKSILTNERYCGDVLGQKTYTESVIGGKSRKNNGELPQVLIQNNHPGIVSREVFYIVEQEEKQTDCNKNLPADIMKKIHQSVQRIRKWWLIWKGGGRRWRTTLWVISMEKRTAFMRC